MGSNLGVEQFSIEISNACVAKCYLCTKKHGKNPSTETVLTMLENMKSMGMKKVRLTGGEPILADNFYDVVKWLKENNIAIEITSTLLTKDNRVLEALLLIDNLRISLSAVKQFYNTYFQINNKWFDVVDSNLRLLLDNGKHLRIDYLLSERTCRKEQLAEFINYVNELTEIYGAKRVGRVTYIKELGSAYKGDVTEALAELRHLEKFNSNSDFALTRYIEEQNKPLPPKCLIARYHMFVKSNGDTYPCCVSGGEVNENFDARLKLGNMLSSENLKQNLFVDESFAPCRDCFNKYKAINERIINLDDELNSINY